MAVADVVLGSVTTLPLNKIDVLTTLKAGMQTILSDGKLAELDTDTPETVAWGTPENGTLQLSVLY